MIANFVCKFGNSFLDIIVYHQVYEPIANIARKLVQYNSEGDLIEIQNMHSSDLTHEQCGGNFDGLVTEIFDSRLIGEVRNAILKLL